MAISIEIQDRGFLELFGEVQIPVTLSVSDIGDIGRRQGARSTTFAIPRTSHNEEILDYISSLTYDSNTRNKNIPANLWENGTLIKKGFLSVTGIAETINAVFFGDNVDWFKAIDGKKLNDIIFPDDYNFIWDSDAVLDGADREEGYMFHLYSPSFDTTGGNDLTSILDKSRPATYAHSILEYIFNNIGVKLSGDLLKDPFYKKIVLPFNKKNFTLGNRARTSKDARVYVYSDQKTITYSANPAAITYAKMDWGDTENPNGVSTDYNITVWNNSTKTYTAPFNGTYYVKLNVSNEMFGDSPNIGRYDVFYNVLVNSVSVEERICQNLSYAANNTVGNRLFVGIKNNSDAQLQPATFTIQLNAGDTLDLEVGLSYNGIPRYAAYDRLQLQLIPSQVDSEFYSSELEIYPSTYLAEESTEYQINDGVDLASTLPEMSQKDFVSYVFNLFGVVPEYDIFSNTLTLNKYEGIRFNKNIAEDWTNKIDFIDNPTFNFNSISGYAKRTLFGYSSDTDDDLLNSYEEVNGETYGTGSIDIDNDFLPEEKTVYTSPFAASQMKDGVIYLPTESDSPRVAVVGGNQTPDVEIDGDPFSAFNLYFDTTQAVSDNGYNTQSLAFGMPLGSTGRDTSALTNYYDFKATLLNKPVLLNVLVRLTEVDIVNLDFNKPKIINLEGRTFYFLLNKISQYKGDGSSTDCELLLMV